MFATSSQRLRYLATTSDTLSTVDTARLIQQKFGAQDLRKEEKKPADSCGFILVPPPSDNNKNKDDKPTCNFKMSRALIEK